MRKDIFRQWEVPSKSSKSLKFYKVTLYLDNTWACSCPAWTLNRSRNDCKHILQKKLDIAQDKNLQLAGMSPIYADGSTRFISDSTSIVNIPITTNVIKLPKNVGQSITMPKLAGVKVEKEEKPITLLKEAKRKFSF